MNYNTEKETNLNPSCNTAYKQGAAQPSWPKKRNNYEGKEYHFVVATK